MARVLFLVVCIAVAGCASQRPMQWIRLDGKPPAAELLEVDRTVCRGEMQKSNLAGFPAEGIGSAYRRGQAVGDVFRGCMAQRGWMQQAVEP